MFSQFRRIMGNQPSSSGAPAADTTDAPSDHRPGPSKTQSTPAVPTRSASGTGGPPARQASFERYLRRSMSTPRLIPPSVTPPTIEEESDARSIRLEDARSIKVEDARSVPMRREDSARAAKSDAVVGPVDTAVVNGEPSSTPRQQERASGSAWKNRPSLDAVRLVAAGLARHGSRPAAQQSSPVGLRSAVAAAMEESTIIPAVPTQPETPEPAPEASQSAPPPLAAWVNEKQQKPSLSEKTTEMLPETKEKVPASEPAPEQQAEEASSATTVPFPRISPASPVSPDAGPVRTIDEVASSSSADLPEHAQDVGSVDSDKRAHFTEDDSADAVIIEPFRPTHTTTLSTSSAGTSSTLADDVVVKHSPSPAIAVGVDEADAQPPSPLPTAVVQIDHDTLSDVTRSDIGDQDEKERESNTSGGSSPIQEDVDIKNDGVNEATLPVFEIHPAEPTDEAESTEEEAPFGPALPGSHLLGGDHLTLSTGGLGTRTPVEQMSPTESMAAARALLGEGCDAEEGADPDSGANRELKEGVYRLVNVEDGMAFDLSAGDMTSVIAWHPHDEDNQQWRFRKLGKGFSIQNCASNGYLSLEDGLHSGSRVVATDYPIAWRVDRVRSGGVFRICWPSKDLMLGLNSSSNHIQILTSDPDASRAQEWTFSRVEEDDESGVADAAVETQSPSLRTTVHTRVNQDGREVDWPVVTRDALEPARESPVQSGNVIEETTTTTTTTTVTTVTTVRRLAARA